MASALFRQQSISRTNDRYTRINRVTAVPVRSFHASNSVQLCVYCRPDRVDLELQFDIWNRAQDEQCL